MKTIDLLYEIGDSVWGIKNNEVKLFIIDQITIIENGIGYQAQPVEKPEYITSEFCGVSFNKENMNERGVYDSVREAQDAIKFE